MILLRKILFYVFFLIYITLCPLLILYALGITFKPDSPKLQRTGIIYLSTIPRDAAVYLNQTLSLQTTPTIIKDLVPGNYFVKVALKGYKPWEKKLTVEATKATAAENILLYPENWKIETISQAPFTDLIGSQTSNFLVAQNGVWAKDFFVLRWEKWFGQTLIDKNDFLKSTQTIPLFTGEMPWNELKVKKIYSTLESPFMLFEIEKDTDKKFFWVNPSLQPPSFEDISVLVTSTPQSISWDPKFDNLLYSFHDQSIDIININDKTIRPKALQGIKTFTLHNRHLYALTNDLTLMRYDEKGENPVALLDDPLLAESLFQKGKNWRIHVLANDIIILLDDSGALICNRLPYLLIDKDILGFSFNESKNRLLIWKNDDIGYIDFSPRYDEPDFEKGPQIKWLNLSVKNIRSASWINNGAQIIFVADDNLLLTETESFGQPLLQAIEQLKKNSSFNYTQRTGRLIYINAVDNKLTSVEIVPQNYLLSINATPEDKSKK